MSKVEQAAGKVVIECYTDGSPLWPRVKVEDEVDGLNEIRLQDVNDLHDLRYACDRMIAKLERPR